jgi:diguanylate cyclase (GGDEF)-like protein
MLVHGIPDFALVPKNMFPFMVTCRLGIASCLVVAGIMVRRNLPNVYPIIFLACTLALAFAGLAGLLADSPMLTCSYLSDACMLGLTAIIFAGRDLRFCFCTAAVFVVGTMGFLLVCNLQPPAAKWEFIEFYAGDFIALIYGRHIQNQTMIRVFLLTLREELRYSCAMSQRRQLSTLAYTDKLTGVPNRRYFDEICASISDKTKNLLPLSICMIDLDYFKKLNDRLGHLQGDRCLKLVGETIQRNLRGQSDIVARYGGEEFVLVLTGTDKNVALGVAERVREAIAALEHAHPGSPNGVVTASIGVADLVKSPVDIEALMQAADQALYRAKAAGRNRVSA